MSVDKADNAGHNTMFLKLSGNRKVDNTFRIVKKWIIRTVKDLDKLSVACKFTERSH